jgi:hypothetical protein
MLPLLVPSFFSFQPTELYTPKGFFAHAVSLHQGFPHCVKFPTAASRRSMGRVSVPLWVIVLSDHLPIIALVSRYLTNKLIGRRLLFERITPFIYGRVRPCTYTVLISLSACYPLLEGRFLRVTHPSATRYCYLVRLACVKHTASVRPEPGSNSPLSNHGKP